MAKQKEPAEFWERLPGETVGQYDKFCAYRDMKIPGDPTGRRSIRALSDTIGSPKRYLDKLSSTLKWVARAEAYDIEMERRARKQNEAAILKMRRDHAELASQMIKKAAKRLLLIPEEELSAADIVRMVDVGVKIERLSRGAPTENRQITGEITATHTGEVDFQFTDDLDFSCLTDGELQDFELMLEKIYRPRD
jgi:hypothetical protein